MRIHQFSTDEFSSMRESWQTLLLRSDANKLFLSWDWMHSWWQTYKRDGFELLLIGAYENEELVCLAPVYIYRTKTKLGTYSSRVEFLGTCSAGGAGFRSEYLQFLNLTPSDSAGPKAIFDWLFSNISFDELILSDLIVDSATYTSLKEQIQKRGCYPRIQSSSTTYGMQSETNFDEYLSSLGKNSRLQIFNRRKVLESLGDLQIQDVDKNNFEEIFDLLSDFHLKRWETQLSYEKHKVFIAHLINAENKSVSGILIRLNDESIGCTFDIDCDDVCYNFQLGFKDNVDKKVSMGSITLGYGLERCFESDKLKYYDLLAGEGKKSNYKTKFAKPNTQFESLQIIRNPLLKILYKLKDWKSKT